MAAIGFQQPGFFQAVKLTSDALARGIGAAGEVSVGGWWRDLGTAVFMPLRVGETQKFGVDPVAGTQGTELENLLVQRPHPAG